MRQLHKAGGGRAVQRKSPAQGGRPRLQQPAWCPHYPTPYPLLLSLSVSRLHYTLPKHSPPPFLQARRVGVLFYSQALYVWEKGRGPCLHFKDIVKEHRGLIGWRGQIPLSRFSLSSTNSPFLTFLNSASYTLNKLLAQQTLEVFCFFFNLFLDFPEVSLASSHLTHTHTQIHTHALTLEALAFSECAVGGETATPQR